MKSTTITTLAVSAIAITGAYATGDAPQRTHTAQNGHVSSAVGVKSEESYDPFLGLQEVAGEEADEHHRKMQEEMSVPLPAEDIDGADADEVEDEDEVETYTPTYSPSKGDSETPTYNPTGDPDATPAPVPAATTTQATEATSTTTEAAAATTTTAATITTKATDAAVETTTYAQEDTTTTNATEATVDDTEEENKDSLEFSNAETGSENGGTVTMALSSALATCIMATGIWIMM